MLFFQIRNKARTFFSLTTFIKHIIENPCQCNRQGKQYIHWKGKSEIATVSECKNLIICTKIPRTFIVSSAKTLDVRAIHKNQSHLYILTINMWESKLKTQLLQRKHYPEVYTVKHI